MDAVELDVNETRRTDDHDHRRQVRQVRLISQSAVSLLLVGPMEAQTELSIVQKRPSGLG